MFLTRRAAHFLRSEKGEFMRTNREKRDLKESKSPVVYAHHHSLIQFCVSSCVLVLMLLSLAGCDSLFTKSPTAGDDFETPFDDLSFDLNATFAQGDENFERAFTVEDGLGPIFNNTGCEGCHPGDGRGTADQAFFRFSIGNDLALDIGGAQHQDRSIPGVPVEKVPAGVNTSRRLPPPVFGVGLIESIPVETIVSNEDENDADGDGISGRPNWVTAADFVPPTEVGGGPGQQLGRFSRKAQVSSLVQQVAEAYQQDIGITTTSFLLRILTRRPADSLLGTPFQIRRFRHRLFCRLSSMFDFSSRLSGAILHRRSRRATESYEIGCATCHVPTMRTAKNLITQLSEKEVHLYSDLLLHDMGDELADNRPDGSANGREWRTAPLWGTRLVADFTGGIPFFLHDGRATTLIDAIRPHGGEARKPKEAFLNLSDSDRQAVIAFLESL